MNSYYVNSGLDFVALAATMITMNELQSLNNEWMNDDDDYSAGSLMRNEGELFEVLFSVFKCLTRLRLLLKNKNHLQSVWKLDFQKSLMISLLWLICSKSFPKYSHFPYSFKTFTSVKCCPNFNFTSRQRSRFVSQTGSWGGESRLFPISVWLLTMAHNVKWWFLPSGKLPRPYTIKHANAH